MPEPSSEQLLEALAEALQTMAFVSVEPPPDEAVSPPDADLYSVRFSGKVSGELQMATPRQFGQILAANMLALEPSSEEALLRAQDAVKELCNITAGLLLRQLCDPESDVLEMGLPDAEIMPDAEWLNFAGTAVLVQAEGFPLALRVKGMR